MQKLVILQSCYIRKNAKKIVLLNEGEIYTYDTFKYRYTVKDVESEINALIEQGLAEWREISKFYNSLTERTKKTNGKVSNRVDFKKVYKVSDEDDED